MKKEDEKKIVLNHIFDKHVNPNILSIILEGLTGFKFEKFEQLEEYLLKNINDDVFYKLIVCVNLISLEKNKKDSE